jgi:hypothetical protein
MGENGGSSPSLSKKILQHHSQYGISGLLKESIPFLLRQVVESKALTADEIVKQSLSHRVWEESSERSISISEPSNRQLRREFKSYPKEFHPRPGAVYEIEDCDLVGPHAAGMYEGRKPIFETVGRRINRTFVNSGRDLLVHNFKSRSGIRPGKSKKRIFPLICPDPSYYHWMMEYLPKLRLLELYQDETGKKPIVLIESNPRDFVRETLESAGYDSSQCKEWDQQGTKVEHLIVTTHRPHIFNYESPELSDYNPSIKDFKWLRDRMRLNMSLTDGNQNDSKRVYISRREASRERKVANRNHLNPILDKFGFETYALEKIPFKQQLRVFYDADVIMGPHGAGLLNMLFAEKPTVIELFPDSNVKPHFYYLADILGCDYHSLVTESVDNNLIIDQDRLERHLWNIIKNQ